MPVSTRIYASGALAFGGEPAIQDLTTAGYSTVLVWSVHVDFNGDLYLNDTQIVSGGVYKEAKPMNLPETVAQLRAAGVEVLFSVGAGGVCDFTNIGALLAGGVPSAGNPLYDNFTALRSAMTSAGGDIDGIDFDNEETLDASVMVDFGRMLHDIGYGHVTLCPYYSAQAWTDTLSGLNDKPGVGFVNAVHLQCYSGGRGNDDPTVIQSWQETIAQAGSAGECLLIPGLATVQPSYGPWWYQCAKGDSVVRTEGTAVDGGADWSKHLRTVNYLTEIGALQGAQGWGGATSFFYCTEPVDLGPGKQFERGDAVFFAGLTPWVSVPQCVTYSLSGGCSDMYNDHGACPDELQARYKLYSGIKTPPQGGFIWFYDSVVDCLLSSCCQGTVQDPMTTAAAYRNAIVDGLSPSG
jgi:hypothetical protein